MDTIYSNTFFDYVGGVEILTDLNIEDLGKIISEELFGNIPFEGLNEYVYEEVPTIFIKRELLGLDIKLFGYKEAEENGRYYFKILPKHQFGLKFDTKRINFSFTLFILLSSKLQKYNNIKIVQDYSEF